MTTFIIIAVVMLATALLCLLVPLLRRTRGPGLAQGASNVEILRSQLAELDADVTNGTMTRENYEQAKRELEQRVLDDTRDEPGAKGTVAPLAGAMTAAVLAGVLPVAAIVLYVVLGNYDAFSPAAKATPASAESQHDLTPEKVSDMAAKLAARLEKEPDNGDGWLVLAHTYYAINKFPEAVAAYERAAKLIPDNADLYADYADALGALNKGLEGKPEQLIARSLEINPKQWKALALAGTVAFNRKQYAKAVEYWERMKETVPANSDIARSIDSSIAEARELGGMKPAAAAAPFAFAPSTPAAGATAMAQAPAAAPAAAPAPKVTAAAPAGAAATVSGTVELSRTLAANASPNDAVFIFARAADGPKVPLAVIRKQVKDLPITFTLDDSMAMAPEMKLSKFPDVVVGARISKSGTAAPQSGDLEGLSKPVKTGAGGIAVIIDTARP